MAYLIEAVGTKEAPKKLTIKNGTIVAPDRAIRLSDCDLVLEGVKIKALNRCLGAYNNCDVKLDADCVLETTGDEDVAVILYSDAGRTDAVAKLEVNGTVMSGKYWCISGNGNANRGITEIVINDGAKVTSKGDSAVYHPQGGTITVNGGLVEGKDGIYMKAGNLVLNGGTVRGVGEKKDYIPSGNGTEAPLGNGVVVEFADYPAGMPTFTKNGGRVEAKNNDAIAYYKPEKVTQTLQALKEANVVIKG